MNDILRAVKERHSKALAKVERAEKSLETARSELNDIEATMRVLGDITGASEANQSKTGPSDSVAERQSNILQILGNDHSFAKEPKELYSLYSIMFGEDANLDTFRTTIWRMKDRGPFEHNGQRWQVFNLDGRYWKEAVTQHDFEL